MRGLNWYNFCRNVQFSGHGGKIITFVEQQENIKKCYVSVRWFALQLALCSVTAVSNLQDSLSLSLPFGHCKLTWNYHDRYFCWIWCIHSRVKYKIQIFLSPIPLGPYFGGEIYWLGLRVTRVKASSFYLIVDLHGAILTSFSGMGISIR